MNSTNSILIELHYLPSVQYFSKLFHYEKVVLEGHENYSKGTYRNRCHIAAANGVQRLSIPLKKGKNRQQNIREVEISYDEHWQSEHWHSIKSAYGNSPYFEFYVDELQPFFKQKETFLWDWNMGLLQKMVELLQVDCALELSEKYVTTKEVEESPTASLRQLDLRNSIQPKISRHKEDPNFEPARYGQVFMEKHGFLGNLSTLDLLFCVGPGGSEVLRRSILKD